jgi:hypothetical protein
MGRFSFSARFADLDGRRWAQEEDGAPEPHSTGRRADF